MVDFDETMRNYDCIFLILILLFGDVNVEYKVHAYNSNGLCALGFMDDHYPVRSAFSLLNKVKEPKCNSIFLCFMICFMLQCHPILLTAISGVLQLLY